MKGLVRWVLSPLDCRVHLLIPAADLPWGVLKARCGAVLPTGVARRHERPPGGAHRTCPTCAEIAKRPCSVPADRWVSPQGALDGRPVAAGHRDTVRAAWARCAVDKRLHLLDSRSVLEIAAQGCALASCGALLTTQNLALRGVGTPCPTCLVAGSAS